MLKVIRLLLTNFSAMLKFAYDTYNRIGTYTATNILACLLNLP